MADFDRYENEGGGSGFVMGLITGTVLGAGLGMLLAPKAGSDLRGAIGEQARTLGNKASEQYRRASDSAGTWAEKGREFVNQAREAVSRGAEEVRGYAGGTTGSSYSTPSTGSPSTGSTWSGTAGSGSSYGTDRSPSGSSGNFGQS
jgi:gas vesicle protein